MSCKRSATQLALFGLAALCTACQRDASSNSAIPDSVDESPQASHDPETKTGFKALDTNSDGTLTSEEHSTSAAAMFDTMDGDKDGTVTAAEMDAAQHALGGSTAMSSADKIKAVDTNKDGQLSRQEHVDGSRSMFAKMDSDANGTLSQSEFEAGHKAIPPA